MSLIDRLKRGENRVEIGHVNDEMAIAHSLIKGLRDSGNDDAKYVLGLADEGKLPMAFVPEPIPGENETWKAVFAVGFVGEINGQHGVANVLVINGQLVNERRLGRDRSGVLRDMADGLSDVAQGIKGGYFQGRVALQYPAEEAYKILYQWGVVTRS